MCDQATPRHSWFSSNVTQLVLMSLVVFACPGMFNALNSLGLGGDPSIGNIVNACLYGTFMFASFFAPVVVNVLGARWSLLFGTLGYPVYALAMYYHRIRLGVAAGAFLGLTAGVLWTAQGQLMLSYPSSESAGRFVAIFWGIFNSGSVLGCCMSFALNASHSAEGPHAGGTSTLTGGTYWSFFICMCCGCALSTMLLPLRRVTRRRADGEVEYVVANKAALPEKAMGADACEPAGLTLAKLEFQRTLRSFADPTMLRLIPLFFYSNFFYSYHFGIAGILFNGRTASLTMAAYWAAQILGSFLLQAFLDMSQITRERRLHLSFAFIMTYILATWVLGGFIQYSHAITAEVQGLDFAGHSRSPILAMVGLFLWGFVDSFVQIWSYYVMSQISQEPEELACFTAFYKFWQCAGAFAAFLLSAVVSSYRVEFWTNVVLVAALTLPTVGALRSRRLRSGEEAEKTAQSIEV